MIENFQETISPFVAKDNVYNTYQDIDRLDFDLFHTGVQRFFLQVKQFYKEFIKQGAPERRKLLLSIAPDPTLNNIQVTV